MAKIRIAMPRNVRSCSDVVRMRSGERGVTRQVSRKSSRPLLFALMFMGRRSKRFTVQVFRTAGTPGVAIRRDQGRFPLVSLVFLNCLDKQVVRPSSEADDKQE